MKAAVGILTDLQKTFDSINHKVLLQKLRPVKFSEQSVQWFRSYLCDQTLWSSLGFHTMTSSAFDLGQWYASSSKIEFMSKLCLMMSHVLCTNIKTLGKLKKNLNEDFEIICGWFVDNKLSIHFGNDKTKSILFPSKWRA